ncbi:hypothetical protein PQR70_26115 [Paraburkholderia madseniana]|uniref:hypothetical protein n=1 Tax=Paraburkholderia madseniana TaxID=2599607 RepID=UPI0038B73A7F
MPLWSLASVEDEPSVTLISWSILEIDAGTRHFVGTDPFDFSGRVSSAVVSFDREHLKGQTQSGRIYQLARDRGFSSNAQYVWARWCEINEVSSYKDVTDQVLAGYAPGFEEH